MDDVGADRDVNRHRHAEPRRGCQHAAERACCGSLRRKESAHRLAETETCADAVRNRAVQQPSGFFGHPEPARTERFVDILRRGPTSAISKS